MARISSRRAPQFVGGGKAFTKVPRNWHFAMPKKVCV